MPGDFDGEKALAELGRRKHGCHIDLGLALARRHARPGVSMSQDELAAFCGCSRSMIYFIERDALQKLRKRLLFMKDPILRDLAVEFFERRRPAARMEMEVGA